MVVIEFRYVIRTAYLLVSSDLFNAELILDIAFTAIIPLIARFVSFVLRLSVDCLIKRYCEPIILHRVKRTDFGLTTNYS